VIARGERDIHGIGSGRLVEPFLEPRRPVDKEPEAVIARNREPVAGRFEAGGARPARGEAVGGNAAARVGTASAPVEARAPAPSSRPDGDPAGCGYSSIRLPLARPHRRQAGAASSDLPPGKLWRCRQPVVPHEACASRRNTSNG
jgi:hypothetical protein